LFFVISGLSGLWFARPLFHQKPEFRLDRRVPLPGIRDAEGADRDDLLDAAGVYHPCGSEAGKVLFV
jgi:hypothetical protein